MNKQDFLSALRENLCNLPDKDINDYVDYYSEMIDDRIEEGLSEEDAVKDIGTPKEAADKIIGEYPIPTLIKAKFKPRRRLRTWEILLIILGSPVWGALAISAVAVVISLVAALVSVVISLYAAAFAMMVSLLMGIGGVVVNCIMGNPHAGFISLACGLVCAGLGILLFLIMNKLTKWIILVLRKLAKNFKTRLFRKEDTK